jgi:hypothetical protein
MRSAFSVLLLAAAGLLAAFNAWQLLAEVPAEDPIAPAAVETTTRAAQPDGWRPGPPRDPHTAPAPDGLLRSPSQPSVDRDATQVSQTPPSEPPARTRPEPALGPSDPAPTGRPHVPDVTAILWSPERPLAVVDGQVVAPGETVGGLQVRRIGRRVVYLSSLDGKAAVAAPLRQPADGTSR